MAKKPVGNINNLRMNIGQFGGNSGAGYDMNMNMLTLLTGANGTGKTMILKIVWLVNYVTMTYIHTEGQIPIDMMEKTTQFLMDKSFDTNDFTGKIEADYPELQLSFDLTDGKVSNLLFVCGTDVKDLESGGIPVFLSADMRLFSDINKYIKLKKYVKLDKPFTSFTDADIDVLCGMYKIYDIITVEKLLTKISDPFFKIDGKLKETLQIYIPNKDLDSVFYDEKSAEIYLSEIKDGKKISYPVINLSAGEQSILNMLIQSM